MSGIGISDTVNFEGVSAVTAYTAPHRNFQERNVEGSKENNFSRIIGSRNNLWKAKNISTIQGNISSTLSDLGAAKSSFNLVKDNVGRIKELVQQAYDGAISGTDLDDAQSEINTLINQIQEITGNTKVNGQNIFDGTFDNMIKTGLNSNDKYDLNFSSTPESVGTPDLIHTFEPPDSDRSDSFMILHADENYIIGRSINDDNGDFHASSPNDDSVRNNRNGSVYVYDSKTRALLGKIESPYDGVNAQKVTNEGFGRNVDVEGDILAISADSHRGWNENDDGDGDAVRSSLFGRGMKIDNGKVYVNAATHENADGSRGRMFTYDLNGNYLGGFENSGTNRWISANYQVSNGKIINGDSGDSGFRGRIQIRDASTGNVLNTIVKPDGRSIGDSFGASFSVDGNKILIGARGRFVGDKPNTPSNEAAHNSNNSYTGKAYLFNLDGTLIQEYAPNPGSLDGTDRFGANVTLRGSYALISTRLKCKYTSRIKNVCK